MLFGYKFDFIYLLWVHYVSLNLAGVGAVTSSWQSLRRDSQVPSGAFRTSGSSITFLWGAIQ